MDRVRLGRALGYGTRHAGKTLAAVVEAATSPATAGPTTQRPNTPEPPNPEPRQTPRPAPPAQRPRSLKHSFWHPLVTFSGALWLRVTGVFFALIAFSTGSGAWRLRSALHPGATPTAVHRFWIFAAFALLFGYFTVSSFVRANLIERRAAGSPRR